MLKAVSDATTSALPSPVTSTAAIACTEAGVA